MLKQLCSLFLCLQLCILVSCNVSEMEGGSSKGTEDKKKEEAESEDADSIIVADEPVNVTGAFLTCSSNGWGQKVGDNVLRCSIKKEEQALSVAYIEKVRFVNRSSGEKVDLNFKLLDKSTIEVTLPDDNEGFWNIEAIGKKGEVLTDAEISKAYLKGNLVRDHSFEKRQVPTQQKGGMDYYILPEGEKFDWKYGASGKGCSYGAASIELVYTTQAMLAPDGNQFIDLDSDCSASGNFFGSNIYIEQELDTDVKKKYLLSFLYNVRIGLGGMYPSVMTASLNVLINGDYIAKIRNIKNGNWKRFKKVIKITSDQTVLRFEETGIGDFYGTVIDDVRFIPIRD